MAVCVCAFVRTDGIGHAGNCHSDKITPGFGVKSVSDCARITSRGDGLFGDKISSGNSYQYD